MQDLPGYPANLSSQQRSRTKTNIVRKVNEIKEAFRIKNHNESKAHEDSGTVVPTFQTEALTTNRDYIKFFIPVVVSRNISSEPLRMGDVLLEHYRLDTMVFQSELFDLYEGTQLEALERVQVKVYGQKEEAMVLAMNEIAKYMHVYEQKDRYFEEGALARLKDFFFYRNKLILVFENRGFSLSRLRKDLPVPMKKNIISKILTTIKHFNTISMMHLDINPSWITIKQNDSEVSLSNLMRSQIKTKGVKLNIGRKNIPGLNYYSPEALLQLQVDQKSDIWSVGCVLYWLNTAKPLVSPELTPKQMIYVVKKSLQNGQKVKTPNKSSIYDSLEMFASLEHSKGMNNKVQLIQDGIQQICQQFQRIQKEDRQLHDLLTRMLTINPAKRISVEESICHSWLG